ncbi:MAG: hypothetical protein QOG75_1922, partial [Mycobacterium sp.]|nr:hypothetical protein [Mycobacterium sp.]
MPATLFTWQFRSSGSLRRTADDRNPG